MIKQAMTMGAWAILVATPALVGAQAAAPSPAPNEPLTCDCPVNDARGNLRDLAAFAPLGLLGAMAAAGGGIPSTPFASSDPVNPVNIVAYQPANVPLPSGPMLVDPPNSEPARNRDALRGGMIAPNTGTPLPSVFLLGSGFIAIGCVAIFRARG